MTVAEGDKLRLVLDLRHVNPCLHIKKFKYEDLAVAAELIDHNFYFTTFDLVSGYHHVDIFPPHQKFLGFQWVFPGGISRYFVFVVLAFGLATACFLFTKLMRPLTTKWRAQGFRVIVYLDDGINIAGSYKECEAMTKVIVDDLQSAGFVINEKKSQLLPTQIGEWLGTEIDTRKMKFSVPEEK